MQIKTFKIFTEIYDITLQELESFLLDLNFTKCEGYFEIRNPKLTIKQIPYFTNNQQVLLTYIEFNEQLHFEYIKLTIQKLEKYLLGKGKNINYLDTELNVIANEDIPNTNNFLVKDDTLDISIRMKRVHTDINNYSGNLDDYEITLITESPKNYKIIISNESDSLELEKIADAFRLISRCIV